MHSKITLIALAALFGCAFTGCQSHEAKVTDLQKQYDQLGDQFQKDCSAEMLNLPQKLSPKCADEKQKLSDAWNRLQAERAKK
jgi:hypothetical protein